MHGRARLSPDLPIRFMKPAGMRPKLTERLRRRSSNTSARSVSKFRKAIRPGTFAMRPSRPFLLLLVCLLACGCQTTRRFTRDYVDPRNGDTVREWAYSVGGGPKIINRRQVIKPAPPPPV